MDELDRGTWMKVGLGRVSERAIVA